MIVNEINRIINSDKFSCSYDEVYLDIIFWDTGYMWYDMIVYVSVITCCIAGSALN